MPADHRLRVDLLKEGFEAGIGRQLGVIASHGRDEDLTADHDQLLARAGDGHIETLGAVDKIAQHLVRVGAGKPEEDHIALSPLDAFHGIDQGQVMIAFK